MNNNVRKFLEELSFVSEVNQQSGKSNLINPLIVLSLMQSTVVTRPARYYAGPHQGPPAEQYKGGRILQAHDILLQLYVTYRVLIYFLADICTQ